MTTIVRSDEISCGGCTATIEKALMTVPGITRVSGNPETKVVTVEHDTSVDEHKILEKMDEAGFAAEIVG